MAMNRSFVPSLLLALLVLALLAGVAAALAPMALDWWVMSSGEEPRSAGPLRISATAGQPVTGLSSAGALELRWGYSPAQAAGAATRSSYLPLVLRQSP
jgi:hypothetical protein